MKLMYCYSFKVTISPATIPPSCLWVSDTSIQVCPLKLSKLEWNNSGLSKLNQGQELNQGQNLFLFLFSLSIAVKWNFWAWLYCRENTGSELGRYNLTLCSPWTRWWVLKVFGFQVLVVKMVVRLETVTNCF
jgi:hypothetical protein